MSGLIAIRAGAPVVSAPASALAIADFLVRTEVERLRLFRQHLRATILQVSPMLLDLATIERIDLTAAVSLMRPPVDWPWRPLPDPPSPVIRQWQARKLLLANSARREALRFRRDFANPGVVIRDLDHPRGRIAIRPGGGVLGFVASLGPCVLVAFGARAMIRLPAPLPDTILTAMPGRRLGQLVDHPLFRDRDCIIGNVVTDPDDMNPIVVFRVPLVPFAMIWPEDGA